jgi:hypothetical protein
VKFQKTWASFKASVTPLGKGEISIKVTQKGVKFGGNLKTGASAELSSSAGPASVSVRGSCTLTTNNTGGCKASASATLKAGESKASVGSNGNASFSYTYGAGTVDISANIHDSFVGAMNWMFEAYQAFEQYTRDISGVPR